MALLRSHAEGSRGPRDRIGVVHCFTGGPEFAAALSEMNFCVSFSGIVTFRNASLIRAAAEIVPEHLLLIETDAPFLAPVPHRGKTNEPARVRHTAETLAKARKCSVEQLAGITRANACRLFGLQE